MRRIHEYEVIHGVNVAAIEFATPYRILIHLMDGSTIVVESVIRYECIDKPARDECAVLDVIEYEAGEM
jgi:hypothetical protein